jgi:hypothetical protein
MDTKNKQIKTRINKKGEEVTYCYDARKYYETHKEKRGLAMCEVCGSMIMDQYLDKHKTTKKCLQIGEIINKFKKQ